MTTDARRRRGRHMRRRGSEERGEVRVGGDDHPPQFAARSKYALVRGSEHFELADVAHVVASVAKPINEPRRKVRVEKRHARRATGSSARSRWPPRERAQRECLSRSRYGLSANTSSLDAPAGERRIPATSAAGVWTTPTNGPTAQVPERRASGTALQSVNQPRAARRCSRCV